MFLRQVIIFISSLLCFCSFQAITGTVFAQSLLSDRQWLEQNLEKFSKKNLQVKVLHLNLQPW